VNEHGRTIVASLVFASFLSACGVAEQTRGAPVADRDATAPPTSSSDCVFPLPLDTPQTSTCPSTCVPVIATQLDRVAACDRTVLVGCIACEGGCGGAPEGPCYRNVNDSRLVRAPTYAIRGRADWVRCTTEEDALVGTAPGCP
jgi:hypothetical protein